MLIVKQKLRHGSSKIQSRGIVLPGSGEKCTDLNMHVFVQVFVPLRAWSSHVVSLRTRKMKLIFDELLWEFNEWKNASYKGASDTVSVSDNHA